MAVKVFINGQKQNIKRMFTYINGKLKSLNLGYTFINGEKQYLWGTINSTCKILDISALADFTAYPIGATNNSFCFVYGGMNGGMCFYNDNLSLINKIKESGQIGPVGGVLQGTNSSGNILYSSTINILSTMGFRFDYYAVNLNGSVSLLNSYGATTGTGTLVAKGYNNGQFLYQNTYYDPARWYIEGNQVYTTPKSQNINPLVSNGSASFGFISGTNTLVVLSNTLQTYTISNLTQIYDIMVYNGGLIVSGEGGWVVLNSEYQTTNFISFDGVVRTLGMANGFLAFVYLGTTAQMYSYDTNYVLQAIYQLPTTLSVAQYQQMILAPYVSQTGYLLGILNYATSGTTKRYAIKFGVGGSTQYPSAPDDTYVDSITNNGIIEENVGTITDCGNITDTVDSTIDCGAITDS